MNLIRVMNKDGSYSVEAEKRYRLFKIGLFVRKKHFRYDGEEWKEEGSRIKVPKRYKRQLDKWLKDHLKYCALK